MWNRPHVRVLADRRDRHGAMPASFVWSTPSPRHGAIDIRDARSDINA
jgi:hypothetical protein